MKSPLINVLFFAEKPACKGCNAPREMSATRPRSEEEFLQISGVGEAKLRRYGAAFLKAIEEYTKK